MCFSNVLLFLFCFVCIVDGIDKASIANSDGPTPGPRTPPFKRKGKLSTIGKIFKPWKWRKKKSEKFIETSAGMTVDNYKDYLAVTRKGWKTNN